MLPTRRCYGYTIAVALFSHAYRYCNSVAPTAGIVWVVLQTFTRRDQLFVSVCFKYSEQNVFCVGAGEESYIFTAEDGTIWRYDEAAGDYVQQYDDEVSCLFLPPHYPQ